MVEKIHGVAAFRKGMAVLTAVADAAEPPRFSDVLATTRLPQATLHRLLSALVEERLLQLHPRQKVYTLGVRLLQLGYRVWEALDVRQAGEIEIAKLRDHSNETVHMAVLDGTEIVYIDKVESKHSIRTVSTIGKRAPSYCTAVGKAMLAFLKPDELADAIERMTPKRFTRTTIIGKRQLLADIRIIRERGFAIDNEEYRKGIRCVAAPIFDAQGAVVASISVTAPSFRLDEKRLGRIAPMTMATARDISLKLGAPST